MEWGRVESARAWAMKRIFVCSPYRAVRPKDVDLNIARALRACSEIFKAGHAPFAPHLIYPRVLDDSVEHDRNLGISAGISWLLSADEMWVFGARAMGECSDGMKEEVRYAYDISLFVSWRGLPPWWSDPLK